MGFKSPGGPFFCLKQETYMGDRANIVVTGDHTDPIFLYTHWRGYAVPGILQAALKRGRGRWGQTDYLTRIIFCELIGDDASGLTGFGISTRITDNERPLLYVVDKGPGYVSLCPEDREIPDAMGPPMGPAWTFEEFCTINLAAAGHDPHEDEDEYDFLERLAREKPAA